MLLRYTLLFFLLFTASALVNRYDQWLHLPPVSIHQWRQADGEATVWHYAQQNAFGQPAIFNLFYAGDNHAVGELPVLYWLAGVWQRYWPCPAYPLRWIGLFLMLLGSWAFGWMALQCTQKPLLAALSGSLLANAPILAYYSPGFLPDAPAFWFVLLMLSSLWQAERSQQPRWLILAALAAFLAIALKISLAILPVALALSWAFGRRQQRWPSESLWSSHWPLAVLAGLALAIGLMRYWIYDYNATHHNAYFLATIRPIWHYDGPFIRETLVMMVRFGLPAYATAGLYAVLLASVWLLWKYWKSVPVAVREVLGLTVLGSLAYVLLWFRMLREHDYYLICLLVLPAILLLVGLKLARKNWPDKHVVLALSLCWVIGLFHSGFILNKRLELAFHPKNTLNLPPDAFIPKREMPASIPATARFLCPEDPSPNIALLALKHSGWTAYNFGERITADTLDKYQMAFGLSHLALRDTSRYDALFQEFFPEKMASVRGWHWYAR